MSLVRPPPQDLRGALRHLGPGLIVSAAIVGSGELIVTTKLGAEIGFTLLWFIILGCLIKVFLQVEFGRYAVSHGRTTLQTLDSIPGPRWIVSWLVWFWMLMFVATFFQVAGMVGGIVGALRLAGWSAGLSDATWVGAVCAVTAVLLAVGHYRMIERFSAVMVAAFTIFTVAAVVALAWTPYALQWNQLAGGLRFELPASFTIAFAAFGIIGVGASELIYYPYWCLEKGYAAFVGPDDGSDAWKERARGWIRVMNLDAWVSMVIYTLATVAFYLLGAAVLHARGTQVTDRDLMASLSEMYRETFGAIGFWGYLAGALIVLYSTVFIATASNGRLMADLLRLLRLIRARTEPQQRRVVQLTCLALPIVYFVLYLTVGAPVSLVLVGALAQALMLPLLAGSTLYLLYRRTDPALRPRGPWISCLWISASLMAVVGLYQAFDQARKWWP
ncbi:MAG: Nramp family divalent metal transporter [Verrucomicrobiae bacterium]|nr:Nramp family divalent metal transporter [Verrucomicrobiae bacterium]